MKRTTQAVVLLLAAILCVYGNGLHAPFNFDDEVVIHQDIEYAGADYFQMPPVKYRHLFYLSLAWNHSLDGFDPFGYHLFNVLLHFLTSVLLAAVAFLTLERAAGWERTAAFRVAVVAALVFALHPVHSETVTYVSGRASGLAGFFCLGSLLCFLLGSLQEAAGRWKRFLYYPASLLCFGGALLSKETSAAFPAVLLLYDVLFMRQAPWRPIQHRIGFFYLPGLGLAAAVLAASPGLVSQLTRWFPKIDLSYAGLQTQVVAYAAKLLLFPVNLSFDYDFTPGFFSQGAFFLLGAAAVFALLFTAIAGLPRGGALFAFGIFWFLLTIAPTNSLLARPDLLSERNLYLPSAGMVLLFAAAGHAVLRSGSPHAFRLRRGLGMACVVFLCVFFSTLLIHRNGLHASNVRLWEDALNKAPGKLRALHNLSHFYLKEKKYPQAFVTLKRLAASRASPFYRSFAHNNLGSLHARSGNPAEAEKEFKAAIAADPTIPTGHFNLASLYAAQGRYPEAKAAYDKAEAGYTLYRWGYPKPEALALQRARVNVKLGLFAEAENILSDLLGRTPGSADGRLLLGDVLAAIGQKERAMNQYRGVSGPPRQASRAQNNLGILWVEQGDTGRAFAAFEKAVSLDPSLADAHFNLGSLLWNTQGRPDRAGEHLRAALKWSRDPQQQQAIRDLLAQMGRGRHPGKG